ncbi:MAG TPA: hypothetical protein VH280_22690 [Verrucomicrobiae bacterium]|jgi:hypothetical protein|nr:hypothetical protein [Verrucomicrobiae bacterium]
MSWDIFVSNFPVEAKTANELPHDFVGKPIGTRHEIIARIREIAPMAMFPDRSWGKIEGPGVDVEIRLGESENMTDFVFQVRGPEASAACVADILRHLKLRALDSATSEFFDLNRPAIHMEQWKTYRDQVLSQRAKAL